MVHDESLDRRIALARQEAGDASRHLRACIKDARATRRLAQETFNRYMAVISVASVRLEVAVRIRDRLLREPPDPGVNR
jgi:hypothetical protein